ncbi:hypothetical protein BJP27_24555 (plasmid) [Pseudomonas oryzihabitans]|nr:hypothetical protein BJP27_23905 [Pseudomonas psychrotolerans]APQ14743.1 hypothetical protein BJP27_24555 [Pseudomonas psychrotolerans]
MSFYKTKDDKVLQARALYIEQCRRVQLESERFARGFAFASAVCAGDLAGRLFIGLRFSQAPDARLWHEVARPGVFEPRDELPEGLAPEEQDDVRQALGALRQRWACERPYFQADLAPLKTLLGFKGVDQVFGMRFHYIDGTDGWFYFHASAQVAAHCVEITQGEYEQAELAAVQRLGRRHDARERARIL